jgi:hypothetical protein
VLLVISTCLVQRFHDTVRRKRRYRWQGQWFLHHDNAPSHTSLAVQQFLSSPKHRTLRISLQVTFDRSLPWKWASRGHVSQPWTSNRMQQPNSRRFQMKPSAGADRWSKCVCVCSRAHTRTQGSCFEGDYVSVAVYLTIEIQYHHSGNVLTAHRILL